jgi:hypothetical protein
MKEVLTVSPASSAPKGAVLLSAILDSSTSSTASVSSSPQTVYDSGRPLDHR